MVAERRAPVQRNWRDPENEPAGTISWEEHLRVWDGYAADGHGDQSAERIAERGGWGHSEVRMYLGHESKTFIANPRPR